MAIQGKARRFALAVLTVLFLALWVRAAMAQVIATPEACKTSTPSDWAWWENMCWNYPSSTSAHRGFLVR